MPIPAKYLVDFVENSIYHVYNRTNNKEELFLSDDNRLFFLKRYYEILSPFVDTFCWNLQPNHFHLIVEVKSHEQITEYLKKLSGTEDVTREDEKTSAKMAITATEKKFLNNEIILSELIEQSFKRFFQSYSLAFNKQHSRKGNLFQRPFKRVEVNKDSDFTQAIIYVHANAQHHKICKHFSDYKWTSWHSIISNKPTNLKRNEVLEWFGGLENFITVHNNMASHYYGPGTLLED